MQTSINIAPQHRPCKVIDIRKGKEKNALFHRWCDIAYPTPAGIAVGSEPAGQKQFTVGLVEYENGQIDEVSPVYIRFLDSKHKDWDWADESEKEA